MFYGKMVRIFESNFFKGRDPFYLIPPVSMGLRRSTTNRVREQTDTVRGEMY